MCVHTHGHMWGTSKKLGRATHWWWGSKYPEGPPLQVSMHTRLLLPPEHSANLCSSLKSDFSWVLGMLIWRTTFMLPENSFWRQNNPDAQVTRHLFGRESILKQLNNSVQRMGARMYMWKRLPSLGSYRNYLLRDPGKKDKFILPF